MAALKLRNYNSKHTFNDNDIWSNDPRKTPMWGKPMRERKFFLFLQFWKLHISKNKTNSKYLSLPSISVLEIYRKKPKLSHLEICAQTAVLYGLSQN